MKIGLCTGGGDCPGLNAAIRAIVKHAINDYGSEVWGIRDSFNGLMSEPQGVRKLELEDVSDILDRGGTILGTTNAGDPFKKEDGEKTAKRLIDGYQKLGLDGIIAIGGDGTQTIAGKLGERGVNLVGVPKTIDNDQASTDISIGFQTAVTTATDAISRLKSTAESHERVMVLEVMGRDAGHIALHSGLAGGADGILLPEIPFDYEPIIQKIERRRKIGRMFSIIVVAEGAFEKGKSPTYHKTNLSQFATEHLGGIGAVVAERLHDLTGVDTRITVLGHIQRGGSPVAFDRNLATAFGVHAVDLFHQKKFGYVVGLRKMAITETRYKELIGVSQPLRLDNFYLKSAESIGICLGR